MKSRTEFLALKKNVPVFLSTGNKKNYRIIPEKSLFSISVEFIFTHK